MSISFDKLFRAFAALMLILGPIVFGRDNVVAQTLNTSKPGPGRIGVLATPNNQVTSESIMDGVNPQRTSAYQAKGINQLGSLLWKHEKLFPKMNYSGGMMTADGSPTLIDFNFSEPIIAYGLVYFKLSIGNSFLIALNARTGEGVWKFKIDKGELSSPAIAEGFVFFGASNGNFYALDARTGQEKWRLNNREGAYAYFSPAVVNGTVYFGSSKGNLNAVDIMTSKAKWSYKAKGFLTSSAVTSDTIYVGGEKGILFAIDTQTGRERWNFQAKGELGRPTVANGVVYFRTLEGNLYALDAKTGRLEWTSRLGGKVRLYFPVTTVNVKAPLALADGVIYLTGEDSLYAIDAETGRQKWRFNTNSLCRSPIVADGRVYVGCRGSFYSVSTKDGQQNWKIDGKNVVFSSPAVGDGSIFFVADDGTFYAMH